MSDGVIDQSPLRRAFFVSSLAVRMCRHIFAPSMGIPYVQNRKLGVMGKPAAYVRWKRRQLYPSARVLAKAMHSMWPKEGWTQSRILRIENGKDLNIRHHLRYYQFLGFMLIAANSYENEVWTKEADRRSPSVRADSRAEAGLGRLLLQSGEPGDEAGGEGSPGLGQAVQPHTPQGGLPGVPAGPQEHRDVQRGGAQDVGGGENDLPEEPLHEMDLPA